jgi:hypothetical protein
MIHLEPIVAKHPSKRQPEKALPQSGAWVSMRTGLIVIAITSIGMAVLTTAQAMGTKGLLEAAFWGLVSGGLIWAIFFGMLLFNRLMGRR